MRRPLATTLLCAAAVWTLPSCTLNTDTLNDGAYLVNNAQDRVPIEGAWVEIESTKNEGSTYEVLAQTTTDALGYFYFDENAPGCFDCWSHVHVYEDSTKQQLLGSFEFVSSEGSYLKKVLHLDTFTLAHEVVLVARVAELLHPTEQSMTMDYRSDLFNAPAQNATNVAVGYTFEPIAAEFTMQLQHWLRFGTAMLATGKVNSASGTSYQGDFVLENPFTTKEGDTVYIDFRPRQ